MCKPFGAANLTTQTINEQKCQRKFRYDAFTMNLKSLISQEFYYVLSVPFSLAKRERKI